MKSAKEKPFPKKSAAYNKGYTAGLDPDKKRKDNPYLRTDTAATTAPMETPEWYEWYDTKGKKLLAENDRYHDWKDGFACGRRRVAAQRRELKRREILDAEYELYANLGEELNQRG